jgi:putative phosphoesterase
MRALSTAPLKPGTFAGRMRLAVLSDIHGNLAALEAVVADFGRRDIDAVINLGDSLSGPLLPLETARFLMSRTWVHLAGNHERQVLTDGPGRRNLSDEFTHTQLTAAELTWIASLEHCQRYDSHVLLCHGTPRSDMEYLLETIQGGSHRLATSNEIDHRTFETDAALVLCGHSHVPRAVRSSRDQLILNPGSVGLPAYESPWPEPHVVETGAPDARYAIVEGSERTWSASLHAVPYNHVEMSQLARARGRTDWAHALATGRMLDVVGS